MLERLTVQWLGGVALYLMMGVISVVHASWLTPLFLNAKPACSQANPYCGAGVPPPKTMPGAKFDPEQTPCDSSSGACAQEYSKMMTENYQQRMATALTPPYNPCAMQGGCASAQAWWQRQVVVPIQQRTIPYDPGQRSWREQKSCGAIFIGGVYLTNPNCQ